MVWGFPLIINRNLLGYGVSVVKSIPLITCHHFDRIKFDQRCLKSTHSSLTYAWNYVRSPSENQVLFSNLIKGANGSQKLPFDSTHKRKDLTNFLESDSLKSIVNHPDKRSIDINQLHSRLINLIQKGNPNCLGQLSMLLQTNGDYLITLMAPFDDHWQFMKKLDSHLVNYCKQLRKEDWQRSQFIDDCLQLAVDLYKFSPPTSMFYSDCLVKNILGKVNNLTKEQFLRLMFCCVISRQPMLNQQVNWSQLFINRQLDLFTLADLSLILIAFHKTRSYINDNQLYKRILTKVANEAKTEQDATLRSSLLKGINYSLIMADGKSTEQLVNSFLEVNNLSVYNYIHLNEFCVKQKFYCPKLIDKSISILENAIEHLREKDVERILKCATAFDHLQPPCPNIDKIITQLDGNLNYSNPVDLEKTIPSLLRSLFLLDIYPTNMINFILSQDWFTKLSFYGPDIHLNYWLLMTIRDCLMIERHSDYQGKLTNLDKVYNKGSEIDKLRISISKIINYEEGKTSMNNKNLGTLYKATVDAFPDRFVQLGYLLSTSLTPDLMLTSEPKHLRLMKGPIRVVGCFTKSYVIVYQGKQTYIDKNFNQISGHYRLRERLLQKLGFTVINVPFYEIYHKTDDFGNDDLVDYIKRRIAQHES